MGIRLHATPHDHAEQVRLGDLLAQHLAGANLLGRLHIVGFGLKKTKRPVRLATSSRLLRFAEDDAQGDTFNAGFSFDVPAEGAISYLRTLTPVTRDLFDGLTRQYRQDAFTVAGVCDQRLIAKMRDALSETLAKGGTPADFRSAINELTSEAGVQQLAAFELDTVFQTNVGKAYSAGRLEQMREPGLMEALPCWQYWTAGDLRGRPAHAALDGFCARAIDPGRERA